MPIQSNEIPMNQVKLSKKEMKRQQDFYNCVYVNPNYNYKQDRFKYNLKYNGLIKENAEIRASHDVRTSQDGQSQLKQLTQAAIGAGIGVTTHQFQDNGENILR